MASIERTYTIPLRKEWLKAPKYRRAKKAASAVKEFLIKHMKSEDIKLGRYLNEDLWKHGMKNPPSRIKINVIKDEKGTVRAEIVGKKIDTGEKKEKKEEKGIAEKMKETLTGKKDEKKPIVKKKKKEETEKTEDKAEEKPKETEKKEEKSAKEETKAEPEKKEKPKAENKKEEAKPEKPAEKPAENK